MTTLWIAAAFVAAYLIGSLSFAVIVSRAMGLDDPRSYGSGNPGATNVLRSGSKKAAVLTLLLYAVKGLIPVLLVRLFGERAGLGEGSAMLVGLGAFLGHLWPVFFRFQGGKGVATAAGVLLGFEPLLGLGVLAIWILVAKTTKYSSLAALIASGVAPLLHAIFWGGSSATLAIFVMSLLLIWRHASNIAKLINGTESRIGQKAKPAEAGGAAAADAAPVAAPANRAERRRNARQAKRKTH